MREFVFNKTESPSMENFNKRFSDLQNFANFVGNEYVWAKTKLVGKYVEDRYRIGGSNIQSGRHDTHVTYTYADSISIDQTDGSITLINPTSVSRDGTYNQNAIAEAIRNKYFTVSGLGYTGVRYCLTVTGSSDGTLSITLWDQVTAKYTIETLGFGYVNSPDPNAYPVNDGYTYEAKGMLGGFRSIEVGSYTGTGTYGEGSANSLTFSFAPTVVWIYATAYVAGNGSTGVSMLDSDKTETRWNVLPVQEMPLDYGGSWGFGSNASGVIYGKRSGDGKTIYWYSTGNAACQFNTSGHTYHYIAFG